MSINWTIFKTRLGAKKNLEFLELSFMNPKNYSQNYTRDFMSQKN
jgi:hypothetical protein